MELTELYLLFKVIRMTGKMVHKRFALTLAVLLVFLISNMAIAYHHHALDELSHDDCPICATANVTSSAVHDFSPPTVQQTGITVSVLTPNEHHTHINPIFLAYRKNRSPPR
jgi:hypothetical protein